eukprot:6086119-Ditylum_brightwellii.AAC.2
MAAICIAVDPDTEYAWVTDMDGIGVFCSHALSAEWRICMRDGFEWRVSRCLMKCERNDSLHLMTIA